MRNKSQWGEALAVWEEKQRYLESATRGLEAELSRPIASVLRAIEADTVISDCADSIEQLYALDTAINANVGQFSPEQWQEVAGSLEAWMKHQLEIARELVQMGETVESDGNKLAALPHLREQAIRLEKDLSWPDYGNSEKFEALVKQADEEYARGETEEGGWE